MQTPDPHSHQLGKSTGRASAALQGKAAAVPNVLAVLLLQATAVHVVRVLQQALDSAKPLAVHGTPLSLLDLSTVH